MTSLISKNTFQLHPMHRQLINSGGIRKLSTIDSTHEQQQKVQLRKALPKNTAKAVRQLPFQNDVICARGRTYWDHPGNQLYRKLISLAKNQYSKAPNRLGKSLIVSQIIQHVHKADGRFVKKATTKGGEKWVECSLNFVREKVTQSLRDGLSFKYSSSTTRKRQRKAQVQEIFYGDIDRIVHSNNDVSQKIVTLQQKVEWVNRFRGTESEGVSDETIMGIFDAGNLDILETIKKDQSMLDELHRVTSSETMGRTNDQPVSASSVSSAVLPKMKSPFQSSGTATEKSYASLRTSPKSQPITSAMAIRQHGRESNGDYSCYDMDLDLEDRKSVV